MIRLVGFDGDDTLWHSEGYYRAAQAQFEQLVGAYVDLGDSRLRERLLDTERRNLRLFGYGAKGMTLSLLETAYANVDCAISTVLSAPFIAETTDPRWMRRLINRCEAAA